MKKWNVWTNKWKRNNEDCNGMRKMAGEKNEN